MSIWLLFATLIKLCIYVCICTYMSTTSFVHKFIYNTFILFTGLNQVTLLGRVGGEPQKRGNEEHPVVTFSLATHVNYKYEGGI